MKDLDIIIILSSGAKEVGFAQRIFDIRKNTRDRLLFLFPKNRFEPDAKYRILTRKENFKLNWNEKDPFRWPYFMINPPSCNDWIDNIRYRISGDPKTENAVLLVDDFKSSGDTIRTATEELINLGYNGDYVFSYAHNFTRYELCNVNGKEITISQLIKLLKE